MNTFLTISLVFVIMAIQAKPPPPLMEINLINLDDSTCKDNGANCRNWALNGFCTNCHYTCQQRRDYCALTCGFCHSGYVCTNCTTPEPTTVKQ